MRNAFIDELIKCAASDERIVLITADLGYSVVKKFQEQFAKGFFNVGFKEQNAISLAAGMALKGKRPFVYSIVPFATMRCFEQIRVDVAYMNTAVRIVGIGAGFGYGPAGATHHAVEDIAVMRSLPNMTVLAPGDAIETRALLQSSLDWDGPIYFRLGKGGDPVVHDQPIQLNIGESLSLREGPDATLIATSTMLPVAMQTAQILLEQHQINVAVQSFPSIKPLDHNFVQQCIKQGSPIFTLEEHSPLNGLGSAVAEIIAESGQGICFHRFAMKDEYTHQIGSQQYLRHAYGLSAEQIAGKVRELIK